MKSKQPGLGPFFLKKSNGGQSSVQFGLLSRGPLPLSLVEPPPDSHVVSHSVRRPQLDGSELTIFVFQGNTTESLDLKCVSSLAPRPTLRPGAALRAMSGGVEMEVGSWLFLR